MNKARFVVQEQGLQKYFARRQDTDEHLFMMKPDISLLNEHDQCCSFDSLCAGGCARIFHRLRKRDYGQIMNCVHALFGKKSTNLRSTKGTFRDNGRQRNEITDTRRSCASMRPRHSYI